MFRYFIGHVYLFYPPPMEELPFIDVPAVTQSDDAAEGLLIQMDADELSDEARERIRPYMDQKILSFEILKANAGVDPDAQIALAESILRAPERYAYILSWRKNPKYEQIEGICRLIWEHFNGRVLGAGSVLTAEQLAYRMNQLQNRPTIKTLIQSQLKFMQSFDPEISTDEAVQNVLDFLRLWPGFHFPRLLRAIDRIQKEILPKKGHAPGDLSPFATEAENLFLDPVIPALEEYGIPIQLGLKVSKYISTGGNLDKALEILRSIDLRKLPFSGFELGLLSYTINSIG